MHKSALCCLTAVMILVCIGNRAVAAGADELLDAVNHIKDLHLDLDHVYAVNNLTIAHRDMRLTLDSGCLAFAEPVVVDGQSYTYAAFYEGDGLFEYSPAEKDALTRIQFYEDKDSVTAKMHRGLFVFSRAIYDTIVAHVTPIKEPCSKKISKRFDESWDRLVREDNYYYIVQVLRNLLEPAQDPFLLANPQERSWSHSYYYIYDPLAHEELRLIQSTVRGPNFAQYLKTLCSYSCNSRDTGKPRGNLAEPQIKADRFTINVYMNDAGDCAVAAKCEYDVLKGPAQILWMFLHEEVKIDSIFGSSHEPIAYLRYEKDKYQSPFLYLILNKPRKAGDTVTVTYYYRGPLMDHSGGKFYSNLGFAWYPAYTNENPADYDIIYNIPVYDNLELHSDGALISRKTVDDRRIEEWKTSEPLPYVQFEFKPIEK